MTTFVPALTLPRAVFDHPASSILLPIALGTAVGYSATKTRSTYERIKNPPYNPPPQVFGPVWTILYGLMGYAAWRSVRIGLSPGATAAQADLTRHGAMIYTIQLGLNLAWTPLFFVLNRPVLAVADIATLLGLNTYLAYTWGQVDRTTGLLQIPYLCWLSFATYLCAGAGYLNNWDLSSKPAPKGKAQ
ncbi:benzodiazepine receptor family protein [Plectosphaerella plurivora]|uniref:Benzodiazepine receptor family protein n=1 Tax=Plectosphaerella plurivora TaxID=936078 RepID=A0A9P9AAB4_9PEZI|nr:benzodiazepine receptor family protein [Plectosphaerella plurivora]